MLLLLVATKIQPSESLISRQPVVSEFEPRQGEHLETFHGDRDNLHQSVFGNPS